jgi:hypothetical protein
VGQRQDALIWTLGLRFVALFRLKRWEAAAHNLRRMLEIAAPVVRQHPKETDAVEMVAPAFALLRTVPKRAWARMKPRLGSWAPALAQVFERGNPSRGRSRPPSHDEPKS